MSFPTYSRSTRIVWESKYFAYLPQLLNQQGYAQEKNKDEEAREHGCGEIWKKLQYQPHHVDESDESTNDVLPAPHCLA